MAPAAPFPLFRLGTLLARQLSKPVAAQIKNAAVSRPWFRRWVCAGTGRLFHVLQLRLRLWTLAVRQPRTLPPISENDALQSGADILGEIAVFALGGIILIFEMNRQAVKQEDKMLEEESRWLALLLSLEELQREVALQSQDIERLQATLHRLAPRHYRAPPHPKPPPPTSGTSERPTLPTSEHPTPPTSEHPTPPTSEHPTPPTSEHPTPPTSEHPTPPTSEHPTPPTSEHPTPPTSEHPTPPTSEHPTPPTSEHPTPPTSEHPTPSTSELSTPVTLDPPTPDPECPPPPIC